MTPLPAEWVTVDLPVLAAALLALIACGTLGNWLVVRREAMTGDAIAHAVFPGIVAGYLVSGSRSLAAMLAGAAIAGALAVLLARWAARTSRLDSGASLGIVFTAMFAIGVALLETQGARQVDLDPGCVLFGSLETLFVTVAPGQRWYEAVPHEHWVLLGGAVLAVSITLLLANELAMLAFDREHARASSAVFRAVEPAMLLATSLAIVASFEAVGSVLVVALLACPSLIAAPFARSLGGRAALGIALSAVLAIGAYFMAAHAPRVFGTATSLNAAGMISLVLAGAVPVSFATRSLIDRRRTRGVNPPSA